MNKDKEEKLVKMEDPELYKKRVKTLQIEFADVLKDCFDFSILDGWAEIVYDLLREIRDHYPDVKVLQVKEKFGGLRFYTDKSVEYLDDLISKAEAKSYETCAFTGEEGSNRQINGWWLTCSDYIYEKAKAANSWFPEKWEPTP